MLAHRILGVCSSSISISCPSLGSELIAVAHAHLWSSFRWCSAFCGQTGKESPLLVHPEAMVSCLLGRSRLFPGPLQAVFTQPTPVFSLRSDLQSPSVSSQPPPTLVGEQTSISGWWMLVGTDPLHENLSAFPSAPLLLLSPPWLQSFTLTTPRLHQWRGFLVCGNVSSFTAPSQRCRSRPYSFVSVFSFFFCPTQLHGGVYCLLGSLRSSACIQ